MKRLNLYTSEISARDWLALFKAQRRCPLLGLSPKAWLRVLIIRPLCNEPNLIFCPRCGIRAQALANPTFHRVCDECGSYALPLNQPFWQWISERIRRAGQQDRKLIPRIKQEFEGWPAPVFEGPLMWINDAWRAARRLRGRPVNVARRALIGGWIDFLTNPCVRVHAAGDGPLCFEKVQSLLPQRQGIKVLQGDLPEEGRIIKSAAGRGVTFGRMSSKELHAVHQAFQARARRLFGKQIQLDEREARRAFRWLETQTTPSMISDRPKRQVNRKRTKRIDG